MIARSMRASLRVKALSRKKACKISTLVEISVVVFKISLAIRIASLTSSTISITVLGDFKSTNFT